MDKKCNKYEAYFTFATQADYDKHLNDCKDCMLKKIKEDKLSLLIKDSAETYKILSRKQKTKIAMYKIACSLLLFGFLGTFTGFKAIQMYKYQQFMNTGTEISIISEEGLPVDEYGFFDYQ